ncbi:hypothetical protein GQ457_08G032930 [Hibiscus cannabinus]
MFPTNHLISVQVAVKIPAPDNFVSSSMPMPAFQPSLSCMTPKNIFPVYESSSEHPNLVRSCNFCCNIDAYELICW